MEESILDEPEETAGSVSKPLRVARQLRGEVAGYPLGTKWPGQVTLVQDYEDAVHSRRTQELGSSS